MSLSESIKDTLTYERHMHADPGPPQLTADTFAPVSELPPAWAQWASGWSHYKPVALFETVGIGRSREPVDLLAAFRVDQTTDLHREVRVARLNAQQGTLHEVPSQVYGELRRGPARLCHLVFQADVPVHEQASYFVFYGNPNAELPEYSTDLRVTGEGYGLDVTNEHFVARLSRQMGQLERLTYKREHGLELYAGGKGHGEPPMIDWAHDYVDKDHFQKLRMRNGAKPPNYEVVKGPLCVRVRRWGFPYSPIHPMFTPSRMHMDISYVFYAGLPYFYKEGRFDMVKDFPISAMRDDEWVFSGYSFTDLVWFDANGKLHEGSVPGEHNEKLWGVGFFHRESRDAFIALWLEHESENFDGLKHNGSPTLSYPGHGQLWSRYPAGGVGEFKAGASIRQKNAYLVLPYPKKDAATELERVRHRLKNALEVKTDAPPRAGSAKAAGALARIGETTDTAALKPAIWRAMREVRDEQFYKIDSNVVDMGYVYDVRVRAGVVHVLMTMPNRGRPVHEFFVFQGGGRLEEGIRERVRKIKGVRDVVVDLTWNPEWSVARMTDNARRIMGLKV